MVVTIDLNCDLGEGGPSDTGLMAVATSANVACGFHAGDPELMERTVRAAVDNGVTVGAHPSYADRDGFGRRALDVPAARLRAELLYQLGALDSICRTAGTSVRYVKPHGALYNRAAVDDALARTVVEAVASYGAGLTLLCPPSSALARAAEAAALTVVTECFADRAYRPDGTLVPRHEAGAVIEDPAAVVERGVRMAVEGVVQAVDGSTVKLGAGSMCVHGDTRGALDIAHRLRGALEEAGVVVRPFAPGG
ncbi:MAG TPA: 5-oxoprolinase subunit PxpA [Acidimicrobiales bacterium]|nr:5-oxoprolinase subunit PxpA [Acidimicrobiales bacterium]